MSTPEEVAAYNERRRRETLEAGGAQHVEPYLSDPDGPDGESEDE